MASKWIIWSQLCVNDHFSSSNSFLACFFACCREDLKAIIFLDNCWIEISIYKGWNGKTSDFHLNVFKWPPRSHLPVFLWPQNNQYPRMDIWVGIIKSRQENDNSLGSIGYQSHKSVFCIKSGVITIFFIFCDLVILSSP